MDRWHGRRDVQQDRGKPRDSEESSKIPETSVKGDVEKGGERVSTLSIIGEVLMTAVVRLHAETCKECRKKYMEIVKHIKEQEKEAKEL